MIKRYYMILNENNIKKYLYKYVILITKSGYIYEGYLTYSKRYERPYYRLPNYYYINNIGVRLSYIKSIELVNNK